MNMKFHDNTLDLDIFKLTIATVDMINWLILINSVTINQIASE